eukprot:CAMPEP_0205912332 /NCGR_PEP_ID=MMETSP1325-20131115/5768_1 /ASSEMBLY_ACC=CAM_ASM_000708 /TAXON_ID=236786 /ORGANISM="Florenciella sp., Strain RCC1007" /LENGTH=60 /DNA_ID=CAMNT_0053279013 /DNA_START=86 /DNA_END=268 /DNA_ORIENTATION=-
MDVCRAIHTYGAASFATAGKLNNSSLAYEGAVSPSSTPSSVGAGPFEASSSKEGGAGIFT